MDPKDREIIEAAVEAEGEAAGGRLVVPEDFFGNLTDRLNAGQPSLNELILRAAEMSKPKASN